MNQQTAKWIDEHREELLATLQKTISFPSVRDESTMRDGAPFGESIAECLDYVLAEAKRLGFETKNLDGYCGCVDYGEGEEQLGILAHLDVVPEGEGWTHPPYGGKIHDGYMWGRGTVDDKGPGIAALFALAAVKAAGLPMRRRVRLILGCDEESGMGCLAHYMKVEKAPDLAFSPDAEYPLINSEKMIYGAKYEKKYPSCIRVKGGTVSNAVTGDCEIRVDLPVVKVEEAIARMDAHPGISYEARPCDCGCGRATLVHVRGKAAHASTPELGANAFYGALDLLSRLPLSEEDAKTVAGLVKYLGYYLHGEAFGIDSEDASGRLTMNCGVIDWDESGIHSLTVDIRAPISGDGELITQKLREGFGASGLTEIEHNWSEGYYIPPESEIVTELMKIYNDYFKTDAKPMAVGGGTYARHLTNAVAFGPERPGEPSCVHMVDERVRIDHLIEDAKICADAIIALACR